MSNHLGIFLNNTNSDLKLNVNLNNYNRLKDNFSNIIVMDIKNIFSAKLKKIIFPTKNNSTLKLDDLEEEYKNNTNTEFNNSEHKTNIIKYTLNNKFLKNVVDELDINKLLFILDILDYNIDYITFIHDDYIYTSNLKDYFIYVEQHKLDFYSFSDSSEKEYHYQLYLFTINSKIIDKFKNMVSKEKELIHFKINNLIKNSIPYVKVAYIQNNINKNIFYNEKIFRNIFINNILPAINISNLNLIKEEFKNKVFNTIPDDFDITIYRSYEDLSTYSVDDLYTHFINYGQYEFRNYKKKYTILPEYLREKLKECELLQFFDVPDDFNLLKYKKNNTDLENFNLKDMLIHWINYGYYENRDYK